MRFSKHSDKDVQRLHGVGRKKKSEMHDDSCMPLPLPAFFLCFFAMPFGYFLPGGLPTSTTADTSAASSKLAKRV